MVRFAIACVLAAGCGDNVTPAGPCDGVDPVFAYEVPLRTRARVLPDGEVLLAGTFAGTVRLGDATLTSAGGTDIFLARIAADGTITARTYGDAADQELHELATNAAGDIAIAGRFVGTLDLGSAPPLIATGSTSSMYLARFSPAGLAFARSFPVEAILRSLAISPTGDVAVAGSNFDRIDFGNGPLPTGAQFLGVVDALGAHVASRRLALEDLSVNLDVGVAFDGDDVLVAGSFTTSIDLGGGPLPSTGALDFYLARFGRGGAHRASRQLGGPGNDGYRGFDGDRVALAPVAGGSVLASSAHAADGIDDILVTSLDATFAPRWTRQLAYPAYQAVGALAIAADGTLAITGISTGATDTHLPARCGGAELSSAFATTFDPGGAPVWTACFPSTAFSAGLGVAWRDDVLVVAGTFDGSLDLGGVALAHDNLAGFVAAVRPVCR